MRFTENHAWLETDGDIVTVGLTDHIIATLGTATYIELPEIETQVGKGDELAVVEGEDVIEFSAPVDGEVVEINEALVSQPGLINEDPMGDGWLLKLQIDDEAALDETIAEDEYRDLVAP